MEQTKEYKSGQIHNIQQASEYSKTHEYPHRFLAYRDLHILLKNFANINKVLDFGCGTGSSTFYFFEKGFDVTGIDQSKAMVDEAKSNFPEINFTGTNDINLLSNFDLVFSSFVLFEFQSKSEIINYLNTASSMLKDNGIFVGITGSEHLHQKVRNWMCFNVNYDENTSPDSGSIVKLSLKEFDMEFYDFFWKETDYKESFQASDLELVRVYYPLGKEHEPYDWKDELLFPPFVIFVAKKCHKK